MLMLIGRRLAGMALVMFIVATMVFFLTRLAPGDPAALMLGDQATPADVEQLRKTYGLDKPIIVQYAIWLSEVVRGNLGQSIFLQRPVLQALAERAEPTFFLALFSILIAAIIGIPSGIASAVWRGGKTDQIVSGTAMLAASIPSFWLGLLFIQFFSVKLGLFPVAGYGPPGAGFLERMQHLILPACVLGIVNSALITRFTRASMLDVLSEDYVRTARAKGLPPARVVGVHALRNALIPVVTTIGLMVGTLLAGAILTESIFSWPGIGKWMVDSIFRRDYPAVQGGLLLTAGVVMVVNLVVDLTYGFINPRIRKG